MPYGRDYDDRGNVVEAEKRQPPLDRPRSWRPVDLSDVLDGNYQPPQPTAGARDDGVGLFYPGRMHTITSESEGGKTWLALYAARHELVAGRAVVFLDFEDDEGGVVGRLLALNTDRGAIRERFAYIRPDEAVEAFTNRADLTEVLGDLRPSLTILDGITEAMTLHGLELKDNTDIARFAALLPRWIAARGPAVVGLDHVVKDSDGRGRYSIGGVHKLNAVDGAAYLLENRQPFGIGLTGRSTIKVAKDRPGQLRRHAHPSAGGSHWFGDLVLTSHDELFVEAAVTAPAERDDTFRPTTVMAKVAAALEAHPDGLSGKKLEAIITGKAVTIRQAVTLLQIDGYVTDSTPHKLLRPYDPETART